MRARSIAGLAVMLASLAGCLPAQCVPTASGYVYELLGCIGTAPGGSQCAPNAAPICAQGLWESVTFPDGWSPAAYPVVGGNGQYVTYYGDCQSDTGLCYNSELVSCPPKFSAAVSSSLFIANAYDQTVNIWREDCGLVQYNSGASCSNNTVVSRRTEVTHTCTCSGNPGYECSEGSQPLCQDGTYYGCTNGGTPCTLPPPVSCCSSVEGASLICGGGGGYGCGGGWACVNPDGTPIVIDTQNQGFHLTDWEHGVSFAFYPNRPPVQLSWTDPAYANGWLVLDRNGNGLIDNATEMFGNITPQPPSAAPNGFLALAVFDEPANGGNGNGVIDPGDAVYSHLRVWIDANHDGISQPDELKTLPEVGIFRIDLKYVLSPFVDQYGNRFRYHGADWDAAGHSYQSCYDVILMFAPK